MTAVSLSIRIDAQPLLRRRSGADYDFTGLTSAQHWLLVYQGWHPGCRYPAAQPSKRTVRKLIERGLVIAREVTLRESGKLPLTVVEYVVPIAVHMAYCMSEGA